MAVFVCKCGKGQLVAQVEESSYMEVSAQLEKVCIGSATALGERPDQQVSHHPCTFNPQHPKPKGTAACRKLFVHAKS